MDTSYLDKRPVDISRVTPAALRAQLRELSFEKTASARSGETWVHTDADEAATLPAVLVPHEADKDISGYWETIDSATQRLCFIQGDFHKDVVARLEKYAGVDSTDKR